MYPVEWIVAGVFLVWLLVLTFLNFRQRNFIKELFPKDNSRDIRNKFKEIIEAISAFEKNNQTLEQRLTGFKKDSLSNIQKLAVLKYNPYNYQHDSNLVRYERSQWFWVDRFDKFEFINDWEIKNKLLGAHKTLLITGPNNFPIL